MLNGRQVQGSIDQALQQALQDAEVIDREVSHLTDRLLKLREEETRTYRELARLRLTTTDGAQLAGKLSATDQQLKQLVEQRNASLARIDAELLSLRARLATVRVERDQSRSQLDQKTRELEQTEEQVKAELQQNPEFSRLQQGATEAMQTARFARQKTTIAENDRVTKGKPYEDDPLFKYLWDRGYGTPAYRANPFSRLMDGWVARIAGFSAARANYALLQEIPRRLSQHADRLKQAADEVFEQFNQQEQSALLSGPYGQSRTGLEQARQTHDQLEIQAETLDRDLSRRLEERNILARGDDEATRSAFEHLEETLRRTHIRELWEVALGTPFQEDDAAVRKLEGIHTELNRVKSALDHQKGIQIGHQQRLQELEKVRVEYRRGGYGQDAWDFRSSDMLSVLLGEMLRGAITRDVFWENMRRHQRTMPNDSFDPFAGGRSRSWPEDTGRRTTGGSGGPGNSDFRTGGGF